MKVNKKTMSAAALLASLILGGCASQPTNQQSQRHADAWITTWGTSLTAPIPHSASFNNQTLRLIAHTTLGGDQVRIRIANTFGTRPLVIGAASIALQESGAALVASSSRTLTFSSRASIIVPPGALVVSDPVKLAVPAQRNLAVSIFIPSDTGPASAHPRTQQISFVSSTGNFSTHIDATPFVTSIETWPFLTGIEVQTEKAARSVVAFGDSITDGFKSTVDANRRWPDYFASRLLAAGRNVAVVNAGISGNRMWNDAAAARPVFGPNGLARFDRDVLSVNGVSHVVVLLGINDIGMGSAARNPDEVVSADDLIAGLKQLATRAHARNLKVIGATLTPFGQAGYYTAQGEEKRLAVNAWIRAAKELDGFVDFDAAVRDPNKPSQLQAAFDSSDHLHPSDAGYKAMADSIDLALFD